MSKISHTEFLIKHRGVIELAQLTFHARTVDGCFKPKNLPKQPCDGVDCYCKDQARFEVDHIIEQLKLVDESGSEDQLK